ncbi:hypothetical protein BDY24DRAFT_413371 [Mrakia frigida]|uniref:uncharacterized protein n=1 Tax=Mrakia frigida TaxID=29902 RepID=UPI003FCC0F09
MSSSQLPSFPMELPVDPLYPNYVFTLFQDGVVVISTIKWTKPDLVGLSILTTLGLISSTSVLSLLLYLLVSVIREGTGDRVNVNRTVRAFLGTDLGVLFVNLLIADLSCSLGWSISLKFIHLKRTSAGIACSLQAGAYVVGLVGVGYWNVAIAFQTFLVLVMRWNVPRWSLPVILIFGWSLTLMFLFAGPIWIAARRHPYSWYGPTPVGCFVTSGIPIASSVYRASPIVVLFYLTVTLFFYVAVAIHVARVLSLNVHGRSTFSKFRSFFFKRGRSTDGSTISMPVVPGVGVLASSNTYTNVIYAFATLPLSIISTYAGWAGKSPANQWYQLEGAFAACLGSLDVVLFVFTRRSLIFGARTPPQPQIASSHEDHSDNSTRRGSAQPRPALPLASATGSNFELSPLSPEEENQDDEEKTEEGGASTPNDAYVLNRSPSRKSTTGTSSLRREEVETTGSSRVALL